MAARSKISQLPDDVRHWLEQALSENGFSQYKELEALLKNKGFDISHAAIHRHGQKLERKMAAIQASTQAAEAIAKAAPDNADHRSAAVIAMIQTSLFDALMDLQEAEGMEADERINTLAKASQGFAKLAVSSVNQKKHEQEVREKLNALQQQASKGDKRLDEETLKYVIDKIYGV